MLIAKSGTRTPLGQAPPVGPDLLLQMRILVGGDGTSDRRSSRLSQRDLDSPRPKSLRDGDLATPAPSAAQHSA
jgi:hypothetical protein